MFVAFIIVQYNNIYIVSIAKRQKISMEYSQAQIVECAELAKGKFPTLFLKDDNALQNNKYYEQSISFFPFWFNKNERQRYILQKQKEQKENRDKTKGLESCEQFIEESCVVIKQKNKDKVLKAFYYDKNDLTFQKMFEENPKEEDFYLICEKINLEHIQNKFSRLISEPVDYKEKKKIVFGRSKYDSNCIGIDDKVLSRKHLILFQSYPSLKEDLSIVSFISCTKKACLHSSLNKIPCSLVKKIISYVGEFQKYRFQLVDASKNGSYYRMKNDEQLTQKGKFLYTIGKEDSLSIKIVKSLTLRQKYGDTEGLDELGKWVSSIKSSYSGIKSFPIDKSEEIKDLCISALVLKITINLNTIYYLLTNEKSYNIGNGDYDISLLYSYLPKSLFGTAYFDNEIKKWRIKGGQEPMWIRMQPKIPYRISGLTQIRLGHNIYFQIKIPKW